MFELIGGAELWQWDTGRQIDCAGLQAGTKVQFAYSDTQTLSTAVKTAGGASVADVPNQMLLRSGALMVYAYVTEADGASYTKYAARLNVQARPKPDDYVYTPTEVQSWQTIRDEIGDLDDLTTTAKITLSRPSMRQQHPEVEEAAPSQRTASSRRWATRRRMRQTKRPTSPQAPPIRSIPAQMPCGTQSRIRRPRRTP